MRLTTSLLAVLLVGASLASCAGGSSPTTSTAPVTGSTETPTTAPARTTTTTVSATSTTSPHLDGLVLEEPGEMDPAWVEIMVLPYGDDVEHLGTSPGGDGEGIMWGPQYGTQMPDGTWWFLDVARFRIAHFSDEGDYLGEAVVPPNFLAQGQYFQFQMPQALADGTLVLSNPTAQSLLLFDGEAFSSVGLADRFLVKNTDGSLLYGFSGEEMERADPRNGEVESVEGFAGPGGHEYSILVSGSELHFEIGGADLHLPVVWGSSPEAEVHPALEAKMDGEGTLHVFVTGFVEEVPGEITELVGYFTVDQAGFVSPVDDMRSPFSPSDPGSPAHLGLAPEGTPWLMFVDTDAVRVFRREG